MVFFFFFSEYLFGFSWTQMILFQMGKEFGWIISFLNVLLLWFLWYCLFNKWHIFWSVFQLFVCSALGSSANLLVLGVIVFTYMYSEIRAIIVLLGTLRAYTVDGYLHSDCSEWILEDSNLKDWMLEFRWSPLFSQDSVFLSLSTLELQPGLLLLSYTILHYCRVLWNIASEVLYFLLLILLEISYITHLLTLYIYMFIRLSRFN